MKFIRATLNESRGLCGRAARDLRACPKGAVRTQARWAAGRSAEPLAEHGRCLTPPSFPPRWRGHFWPTDAKIRRGHVPACVPPQPCWAPFDSTLKALIFLFPVPASPRRLASLLSYALLLLFLTACLHLPISLSPLFPPPFSKGRGRPTLPMRGRPRPRRNIAPPAPEFGSSINL